MGLFSPAMQLSQGITGLLAVGLVISLVTNVRRSGQIVDLEARLEAAKAEGEQAGRETTRTIYADDLGTLDDPDDPNDKPPLDDVAEIAADLAAEDPSLILSLPEVEEAIEEHISERLSARRKAWQQRHLDANRDHFATYAEEADLDDAIVEEVDTLMEETMLDIATLRQERHAGDVADDKAFEELSTLRTDFRADLVDLLGEDEADQVQDHLMGPLSRGYYSGGNTPQESP